MGIPEERRTPPGTATAVAARGMTKASRRSFWLGEPANPAVSLAAAPANDVLPCRAIAPKRPSSKGRQSMAHNFAINDDVHHQLQGPQGRAVVKQRSIYTIVTCLPIESDGRPRYRIKSKTENVERVVTEEQISRLG
jgi:hypothetical protein